MFVESPGRGLKPSKLPLKESILGVLQLGTDHLVPLRSDSERNRTANRPSVRSIGSTEYPFVPRNDWTPVRWAQKLILLAGTCAFYFNSRTQITFYGKNGPGLTGREK